MFATASLQAKPLGVLAVSVAALAAFSSAAPAATLDWDVDPGTWGVQPGAGTWYANEPTAQTWRNGGTQTAWVSGSDARFETAGRSNVSLSGNIQVLQLLNHNGGLLSLASGSSLSLNSVAVIGYNTDAAAAFHQSGGSFTLNGANEVRIGYEKAYGFYNISGGTLTKGAGVTKIGHAQPGGTYGIGALYQSGGDIVSAGGMQLSNGSNNASSVYYMSGGTYTYNGTAGATTDTINLASFAGNSHAQLTITNATMVQRAVGLGGGTNTGQTAILNLNAGGILEANKVAAQTSSANVRHVNFNGGTLRYAATASGNDFLQGGGNVYTANVYAGGATLEVVNSGTIATAARALVAPAGNGVSGTTYTITDGGSGYVGAPIVRIDGVTGATAVANMIDDGTGNGTFKVASITITAPGIDATATPTLNFIGGGATAQATAAGVSLSTAPNVSGGLTKKGAGTLNLTAFNTYTGETRVDGGKLVVTSTGDIGASSGVNVRSGGIIDLSPKSAAVAKNLKGGGEVIARNDALAARLSVSQTLAPGDSVGTLTISAGDLRIGDGAIYEYEIGGTTAAPESDLVHLTQSFSQGDLSFDGAWTVKLAKLGAIDPTDKTFVLFQYTGIDPSLGTWSIDPGSTGWQGGSITVDSSANQVLLSGVTIPEPAALSLLPLGALLIRRRR